MATGHVRTRTTSTGEISYQITIDFGTDPITGRRDRHYETVHSTKKEAKAKMRELILLESEKFSCISDSSINRICVPQ